MEIHRAQHNSKMMINNMDIEEDTEGDITMMEMEKKDITVIMAMAQIETPKMNQQMKEKVQ